MLGYLLYVIPGIDLGSGEPEWVVSKERRKWDEIFMSLGPSKGKITGSVAKKEMIKSRLPNPVLAKVWRLADVDGDGMLDSDEFALAMHLINVKLDGEENNQYLSKNVNTTFQGMICPRNFQRIWFLPRKEAFEVIEHRH